MITHDSNFPPFRTQLRETFGYLSFQCVFVNLDIVGVRLKKSYEVIAVLFRGYEKCGWLYEGCKFSPAQVIELYNDVPNNRNELEAYEEKYKDKIEILVPPKDNFVFVADNQVKPINQKEYDRISKQKIKKDSAASKRSSSDK